MIKRRVKAKQGFREFPAARRTIQGYEAMYMIRKGQARGAVSGCPSFRERRRKAQLFSGMPLQTSPVYELVLLYFRKVSLWLPTPHFDDTSPATHNTLTSSPVSSMQQMGKFTVCPTKSATIQTVCALPASVGEHKPTTS